MSKPETTDPYEQGCTALIAAVDSGINPYPLGTSERARWWSGYSAAASKVRESAWDQFRIRGVVTNAE